jgi:hypothetical protein
MSQKSSSLTGPLWVIAVGILILGIGASYTFYMLRDSTRQQPEAAATASSNASMPGANPPTNSVPAGPSLQ